MSNLLKGKLFIIAGPSGVGKGTVIEAIKKRFPQFVYPISHTTRAIRPGEKEGEVYHFISTESFKKGIEDGEFLEYAVVHKNDYYGTLKKPIMDALERGRIVIREVDVQGVHSIKKMIPQEHLTTIFITAESSDKLLVRINKRSKLSEEELARRMASARIELGHAKYFDYKVVNKDGHVEECIREIIRIIAGEAEKVGLKI